MRFDLQLPGSARWLQEKLESLDAVQLFKVKEVFATNGHPKFDREFASVRCQPFGNKAQYVKALEEADLPRMCRLIKVVGVLLGMKAYLFWMRA